MKKSHEQLWKLNYIWKHEQFEIYFFTPLEIGLGDFKGLFQSKILSCLRNTDSGRIHN